MIVRIGGVRVEVAASAALADAVRERFLDFAASGEPDVSLRVIGAPRFSEELRLAGEGLAISASRGTAGLELTGATARGAYHADRREGELRGVTHLGEIDALVRLALSIELPRRGAALVHGASLTGGHVLLGASGAGKSTAARALGALSDELTVIHVRAGDVEGTAWWRGRPERQPLASLRVLERGAPSRERLSGVQAVRAILPHAIRYAVDGTTDQALLGLATELCARVPVERVRCPEGAGYLPFLRGALAEERAA